MSVPAGTWVQVMRELIPAGQRVDGLPEATAGVPLVMRVRGFLTEDANIGDQTTVRTYAGREVRGELVDVAPIYDHGFGRPDAAVLEVGRKAREIVRGGQ